jgi:hypothetical protein
MAFNTTFANDLAKLIFNATAIANIADNASSSPLTALYVALHTADPGAAGTGSTNECAYGSYARVSVNRNSGGWTVSTNTVVPVADISFPEATSGTETATHWSITVASSGASKILARGALSPTIAISTGITPIIDNTSVATFVTSGS